MINRKLLVTLMSLILLFTGCITAPQASNTPSVQTSPIPVSNSEIRLWYNHQVVIIPALNNEWLKEGLSAEERAIRAYEIRHNARINARYLMQDKEEVETLRERDREKYGNPDGPTFEYLLEKNRNKGLSDDECYEEIVKSSSRTSAEFNKLYGIVQ